MHVEIRPAARLRGKNAVDLLPALGPALDAVIADPEVDLARLRITADWVQYRQSFRPPVMLVPSTGGNTLELAVDLRRADDADATASAVAAAFRAHRTGGAAGIAPHAGGVGADQPQPHLAVQRPLLAAPPGLGGGDRPELRVRAARRAERRAQGRTGARHDRGAVRRLGLARGAPRAARGALRRGARGRQRQPGPHLARRVPRARRRARPPVLPAPALPDGRLLAPRPGAGAGRGDRPRPARQLARARRATADDRAGLPAVQGLPGLHLQRLRQPPHRRDRHDRPARAPRRRPAPTSTRPMPPRSPRRSGPPRTRSAA